AQRRAGVARGPGHGHRGAAARASGARGQARDDARPGVARGRGCACRRIPDRQRARRARRMTVAAPALLLAISAFAAFALRKRVAGVAAFGLGAIVIAFTLVAITPVDTAARLIELDLRVSDLWRLSCLILLATSP